MLVSQAIADNQFHPIVSRIIPTVCGYCGTRLEIDEPQTHLYCPNELCSRLLANRMEKMAKELKIRGLGQEICMNIVETHDLKLLSELFMLEGDNLTSKYGYDYNMELYDSIQSARKATLATIIKSLGLTGIGSLAEKIFKGYNDINKFYDDFEVNPDGFISEKIGKREGTMVWRISENLIENKEIIIDFVSVFEIEKVASETLEIVVTGSVDNFKTREVFVSYLNATYGEKVNIILQKAVTKDTFALVSEKKSSSNKFKKAESYGVPIWTSHKLIEYIEENYGG